MNAIEVKSLCKKLHSFKLENISFSVEQGTVMGLVGQNGAGKTSIINCILQLFKQDSGQVKLFDKEFNVNDIELKQEIGVVFDTLHFPDTMTGKDAASFYKSYYKKWDDSYFKQLTERLDVSIYKKIKDLSHGTKMKLSIALAMSYHPKLLILDEPTSGLDPLARDEILRIFAEFMEIEERAILLSSHITSDLEKIADTITVIYDGEVLLSETKDKLMYEYGLWRGSLFDSFELPKAAILAKRESAFGVDVLVNKSLVNATFTLEIPELEDVIVMLTKAKRSKELQKLL